MKTTLKTCCTCKQEYPISEFYNTKSYPDGKSIRCKTCCNNSVRAWQQTHREKRKSWMRNWSEKNREKIRRQSRKNRRLREYGITDEQYIAMWESQKGRCAICKCKLRSEEDHVLGKNKSAKNQHVDHCHNSGKTREILCPRCNHVLGLIEDNVELMATMISYLNKHKKDNPVVTAESKATAAP